MGIHGVWASTSDAPLSFSSVQVDANAEHISDSAKCEAVSVAPFWWRRLRCGWQLECLCAAQLALNTLQVTDSGHLFSSGWEAGGANLHPSRGSKGGRGSRE
eukprot:773208-Amphidinium_carterae.1